MKLRYYLDTLDSTEIAHPAEQKSKTETRKQLKEEMRQCSKLYLEGNIKSQKHILSIFKNSEGFSLNYEIVDGACD